jgi:ankyrin repeat protein
LNPITDEMIQAAEKKGKYFLAEQLRKLQKEALTERNMPYINDKTDGDTTALYEAADALFQRPDIVQVLLERGANPNMEDAASDTVLGAAVSSTSISDKGLKTIELLLDAGADLFGGKKGFGPLYSAIDNAEKDIRAFEFILSKMPHIIHTKDVNGNTALHYAVSLEREKVIKFLLIDKKSKPNIVNKQNKTPKDLAKVKNKNIRALFGLP